MEMADEVGEVTLKTDDRLIHKQHIEKTNIEVDLLQQVLLGARYFVVYSISWTNIVSSMDKSLWVAPPKVAQILNLAFTKCSSVILLIVVQKSGKFAGFARVASLSHEMTVNWQSLDRQYAHQHDGVFNIDWISSEALWFPDSESLQNSLDDNKLIYDCEDGKEVDPAVGEWLCKMMATDAEVDLQSIIKKCRKAKNKLTDLQVSKSSTLIRELATEERVEETLEVPAALTSQESVINKAIALENVSQGKLVHADTSLSAVSLMKQTQFYEENYPPGSINRHINLEYNTPEDRTYNNDHLTCRLTSYHEESDDSKSIRHTHTGHRHHHSVSHNEESDDSKSTSHTHTGHCQHRSVSPNEESDDSKSIRHTHTGHHQHHSASHHDESNDSKSIRHTHTGHRQHHSASHHEESDDSKCTHHFTPSLHQHNLTFNQEGSVNESIHHTHSSCHHHESPIRNDYQLQNHNMFCDVTVENVVDTVPPKRRHYTDWNYLNEQKSFEDSLEVFQGFRKIPRYVVTKPSYINDHLDYEAFKERMAKRNYWSNKLKVSESSHSYGEVSYDFSSSYKTSRHNSRDDYRGREDRYDYRDQGHRNDDRGQEHRNSSILRYHHRETIGQYETSSSGYNRDHEPRKRRYESSGDEDHERKHYRQLDHKSSRRSHSRRRDVEKDRKYYHKSRHGPRSDEHHSGKRMLRTLHKNIYMQETGPHQNYPQHDLEEHDSDTTFSDEFESKTQQSSLSNVSKDTDDKVSERKRSSRRSTSNYGGEDKSCDPVSIQPHSSGLKELEQPERPPPDKNLKKTTIVNTKKESVKYPGQISGKHPSNVSKKTLLASSNVSDTKKNAEIEKSEKHLSSSNDSKKTPLTKADRQDRKYAEVEKPSQISEKRQSMSTHSNETPLAKNDNQEDNRKNYSIEKPAKMSDKQRSTSSDSKNKIKTTRIKTSIREDQKHSQADEVQIYTTSNQVSGSEDSKNLSSIQDCKHASAGQETRSSSQHSAKKTNNEGTFHQSSPNRCSNSSTTTKNQPIGIITHETKDVSCVSSKNKSARRSTKHSCTNKQNDKSSTTKKETKESNSLQGSSKSTDHVFKKPKEVFSKSSSTTYKCSISSIPNPRKKSTNQKTKNAGQLYKNPSCISEKNCSTKTSSQQQIPSENKCITSSAKTQNKSKEVTLQVSINAGHISENTSRNSANNSSTTRMSAMSEETAAVKSPLLNIPSLDIEDSPE